MGEAIFLRSSFFVSLMAIPTSLIPTLSFDTISSSASYSSSSFSLQFLKPFKPHCHGLKMYNPTSSGSLAVNSSTREMGSNSDPLNGRYRHARPCIFFFFFSFSVCVSDFVLDNCFEITNPEIWDEIMN